MNAPADDTETQQFVVHVAEIRLRTDDPWDVCDVGVYPIVNGLEDAIATLSDRLDAEFDRQQETDRKRWVTRTLGGKLREVRVETVHRGGQSYFRHRIMRADNGWLDKAIVRSTPTGESSPATATTDRPGQPEHTEHHEGGDADHDQDQQNLCGSKVSHRSNVAGDQVTGASNE